jgi:ribosomal-protein-alanine N-acetyltransferase
MTVRLVHLPLSAFEALAAGDPAAADRLTGLSLTPWFAGRTEIWEFMVSLAATRPENAEWLMQAVVLGEEVIGNAGFKGAPVAGVVELGYSVDPAHRRRGHATTVVDLLVDRARDESRVDRVITRIDPANVASIGVVTKAGFLPDGEFVSPRSGRQLQFVHDAHAPG